MFHLRNSALFQVNAIWLASGDNAIPRNWPGKVINGIVLTDVAPRLASPERAPGCHRCAKTSTVMIDASNPRLPTRIFLFVRKGADSGLCCFSDPFFREGPGLGAEQPEISGATFPFPSMFAMKG